VLGGLFITLAALGVLVGTSHENSDRRVAHTVLARDVQAGELVDRSAFTTALMELAPGTSAQTLDRRATNAADPDATWVVQISQSAGTLALGDAFLPVDAAPETTRYEYSMPIAPVHAANGNLGPGMSVDVVATGDSDGRTSTRIVADDVEVLSVADTKSAGNGSASTLSILLGFDSYDDLLAVRTAEHSESIALIDTTRLPSGDGGDGNGGNGEGGNGDGGDRGDGDPGAATVSAATGAVRSDATASDQGGSR